MIYYEQNSKLGIKVVKTFDGKKEYRKNCKRIKSKYYVKDKDCFEINGKWYEKNSGLIFYDYYLKRWFLKGAEVNLLKGIVDFSNGNVVLGYFTPNKYDNCDVFLNDVGRLRALNHLILAENGFTEDVSTGIWYKKLELSSQAIRNCSIIANKIHHNHKGYNIEDNEFEYEERIEAYNEYEHRLSKDVRKYARFLGDTTFGLEIECNAGYLPEHIQNRTGVVICKDGSLDGGPEFTTIPLSGAKGLQTINMLSTELTRRTTISKNCSFHIHIGNVPTSRLFLTSLYSLCYKIQDEIFEMFPMYNIHWQGVKKKAYCQKLQKKFNIMKVTDKESFENYVDDCYTKIFTFLTEGVPFDRDYNRKKGIHPQKQKWDRHSRYYWANLMNTIFGKRNTIEFRIHTPTTNSQKMINWLFICNAIVRYAILHTRDILTSGKKIDLNDVLDYYKSTFSSEHASLLSDYLKAYVKERTARFQKDWKAGDVLSEWEISEDKIYEFKFNNTTHLF